MTIALNLPIQKRWLDMIVNGGKREEYCDPSNRQVMSFVGKLVRNPLWAATNKVVAIFRAGYRMDSPSVAIEILGWEARMGTPAYHSEWGEPQTPRLVLLLGEIIRSGANCEIKEKLAYKCANTKQERKE